MRQTLLGTIVLLAMTTSAEAQSTSTGIRDVTASDKAITTLNTQLRFTTLIVLPSGEEIVEIVCGDKDNWVISWTHNIAHVKPTKEKATTNLNLVGTSGAIYSFLLKEGSGSGITNDLRVNVAADPERAAGAAPKYFTADTVDALRRDIARAEEDAAAQRKAGRQVVEETTARAPLVMQFPYEIPLHEKPFLVRGMWTDGTFTYLRTDAQELPALYEVKDDKPSLIQFSVTDGVYIVPKILDAGYLQLGKTKLAFRVRKGEPVTGHSLTVGTR